jgi:hypothetical protein
MHQPQAQRVCQAGCLIWPASHQTAPKKVHNLYSCCPQVEYACKLGGPPTQECSCHSNHDMLLPFAGPPNRHVAAGEHTFCRSAVAWNLFRRRCLSTAGAEYAGKGACSRTLNQFFATPTPPQTQGLDTTPNKGLSKLGGSSETIRKNCRGRSCTSAH